MLILRNNMKDVTETERFPSSTFKMKDLGLVHTILGIKVTKDNESYVLI